MMSAVRMKYGIVHNLCIPVIGTNKVSFYVY